MRREIHALSLAQPGRGYVDFREPRTGDVPGTPLLGTWVNRVSCYILSTHCARHSGASNGSPKYSLALFNVPSCTSNISQTYTRLLSYSSVASRTQSSPLTSMV